MIIYDNLFIPQYAQHEAKMQEYLASEWSSRFKAVEKEFEDGISKFDELNNRLTLSHKQLDARERFMKAEEARVSIFLLVYYRDST